MTDFRVGIIGLGYVGLPLAVESGKKYPTVGFDINEDRIHQLKEGVDLTREVEADELSQSEFLSFSSSVSDLQACNFYIVTVPTPVDKANQPDLRPIVKASEMLGGLLKKGDVVVYESTVFPGCTEEVCVPILEHSGLVYNVDFFCGYSPERINPGDKVHRLVNIRKITSGSNSETAARVDLFYASIIEAGTYKAKSIKVAEAAKVIENAQRDINIAFVNELAMIFNLMDLDTLDVLEAAGTKWNFLPFKPGLVGGHCIGVDPYYLTYKAEEMGYHTQVILSGRQINDGMGSYVGKETVKLMARKGVMTNNCSVLVMGITFKENCPDVRNTKVVDIISELREFGVKVDIHDPLADPSDVKQGLNEELLDEPIFGDYDAIVLAVSHDAYQDLNWNSIRKEVPIIFDVKGVLSEDLVDSRL